MSYSNDRMLGHRDGVRAAITWLHELARSMGDPNAKTILNTAAFNLGVDLSQGRPFGDSGYSLGEELLREAIEDDGLSRSTLKIMARMKPAKITPEVRAWAEAVAMRAALTTGKGSEP